MVDGAQTVIEEGASKDEAEASKLIRRSWCRSRIKIIYLHHQSKT